MASFYNLYSDDGLAAFWAIYEILEDVIVHPLTNGDNVAPKSFVISKYMLREVGLRFPLLLDLYYLLNWLKLSLEC